MDKRVAVTGLGVVSSIGIGKDDFWTSLIEGRSGISEVTSFDTSSFDVHRGGEVRSFDPGDFIKKDKLKYLGRASQFAYAASKLAVDDAGISLKKISGAGTSVIIGTTMGEGGMIEEIDSHWVDAGEADVWALTISKYPGNALANNISRLFGINGLSWVIPTACAAGNYSIGLGYDLIRTGKATTAIVGGADPFSRIGFTGFGRLFAMSPDICSPFDKDRKGMIVGEGSGILILEDLEQARERDARIYAEVKGYGISCDAHHMTAPHTDGIRKSMEKALRNSGIDKEDVGYICAHGTGTPANDKAESEAVRAVFGAGVKDIPVSSIKSMLGHTMGAASAIEAVSCIMALSEGVLPPTINHKTPDPECDIDCVPNKARKKDLKVVMNNSSAFGGNNACVIFKKYE